MDYKVCHSILEYLYDGKVLWLTSEEGVKFELSMLDDGSIQYKDQNGFVQDWSSELIYKLDWVVSQLRETKQWWHVIGVCS